MAAAGEAGCTWRTCRCVPPLCCAPSLPPAEAVSLSVPTCPRKPCPLLPGAQLQSAVPLRRNFTAGAEGWNDTWINHYEPYVRHYSADGFSPLTTGASPTWGTGFTPSAAAAAAVTVCAAPQIGTT